MKTKGRGVLYMWSCERGGWVLAWSEETMGLVDLLSEEIMEVGSLGIVSCDQAGHYI
jgi:hypothetical protein